MPKVVVSGYYGFKNFGDEAILSVLTEHLKNLGCEVTVFSSNPEYTKSKDNVSAVKSFDLRTVINEIKSSDILISGGGSLLQDVTSLKSLVYYALIILLAQIFHKKVIIFAQGIGPLKSFVSKFIIKTILKRCDFITVRDENSKKLLDNWKIPSKLVCDPIFSLKIPTVEKNDNVIVQLRSFPTLSEKFLTDLAKEIIKSYSDKHIGILSLQDSLDLEVCEKFNKILKSQNNSIDTTILSELDNKEITRRITSAQTLIAMRFHAILIGIKAGVKTLAINYDIKVEKIAKDFNLPTLNLIDNNDFEKEFETLKNLEVSNLIETSKSKIFDWSDFDKSIV